MQDGIAVETAWITVADNGKRVTLTLTAAFIHTDKCGVKSNGVFEKTMPTAFFSAMKDDPDWERKQLTSDGWNMLSHEFSKQKASNA